MGSVLSSLCGVLGNNRMKKEKRTIHQPLHPSIRPLLDPEYVAFHEQYAQYVEKEFTKPWDPKVRSRNTWPYAGSPIVQVGNVRDILAGGVKVRVFTPEGSLEGGWPLLIWFHGGGFVVGDIDSDNDLCSLICRDAKCVVLNVDYRLAPEHRYPEPVEDVRTVLTWTHSEEGRTVLGTSAKTIIGGASAGGNLAAVGALLAADMRIPLVAQLLVAPVIDNTATLETSWSAHPHAPWLSAARMTWFRELYLDNLEDAKKWEVSPTFAPDHLVSKLPSSYIFLPGQDMLSTEGATYGTKLTNAGVTVVVKTYDGMPHSMMALSGALTKGRQCMLDAVEAVKTSLGT